MVTEGLCLPLHTRFESRNGVFISDCVWLTRDCFLFTMVAIGSLHIAMASILIPHREAGKTSGQRPHGLIGWVGLSFFSGSRTCGLPGGSWRQTKSWLRSPPASSPFFRETETRGSRAFSVRCGSRGPVDMISKAEVPRTRSSWPPSRTMKEVRDEVVLCERCGHPLGSEVSKRKGLCGMCDRGETDGLIH